MWRYAGYYELAYSSVACVLTSVIHSLLIMPFIFYGFGRMRMPFSYYIFGAVFQYVLIVGARFGYKALLFFRNAMAESSGGPRIMIVGCGSAGQMILRDIKTSDRVNGRVCCLIDDNPNKKGRFIDGVKVVGDRYDIIHYCKKYHIDKIYVAIPSAKHEDLRAILDICKETGCELKNLPAIYQLVNGEVNVSQMRNVDVLDLLGREPVKVDLSEIFEYIKGKRILVTGGGGSIGSELCRQVANHSPALLLIYDVYENNAYDIQQELKRTHPELNLAVEIGSVRDSRRLNELFARYKPDIVYHAAAHKHVPLMEDSPNEAIKNNVFGTYKTAYAAMMNGVQRFVLISTDKAVNPTNIMGASKRICEMIIQAFDQKIKENKENEIPVLRSHMEDGDTPGVFLPSPAKGDSGSRVKTEFVAVRFGNVLGSNGSVIPLFKKQIETTRVVTVTHKDIIRYFMTIPEAVSLVLEAGTYAKGGEIFVLDMGEPVKIDTLARNLIKLSGLRPDVDVKIEYTGLRPGEKLYEEKLMSEEGLKTTPNNLIHIGNPIAFDIDEFLAKLSDLLTAAFDNSDNIRELVMDIVDTYHPADNS
ncbi:MAG: polysaccharide biosynthesis protein [Clostridia bacterium]|nr:polysaccharide biosynthesis protein [Clostridia bacterium]